MMLCLLCMYVRSEVRSFFDRSDVGRRMHASSSSHARSRSLSLTLRSFQRGNPFAELQLHLFFFFPWQPLLLLLLAPILGCCAIWSLGGDVHRKLILLSPWELWKDQDSSSLFPAGFPVHFPIFFLNRGLLRFHLCLNSFVFTPN